MKSNPYLEIIIAGIIWGTHGIFVKYINLPPTSIAFFRVALPTIILLVYFKIKKINILEVEKKKLLLFISFLFAIKTLFTTLGFLYAGISSAIIVVYSWPIFASLFSIIILKEKFNLRNSYLLFLAFIGILFIFYNQNISLENIELLGLLSMLIAAILIALVIVLLKKVSDNSSRSQMIFYQNVLGTFMFFPFIVLNNPLPHISQIIIGMSFGTIIGLVGFMFFFSGLKKINASVASHLAYVEIISAIILGIIIFKETLTWNLIVGGSCIIVSSYFLDKS